MPWYIHATVTNNQPTQSRKPILRSALEIVTLILMIIVCLLIIRREFSAASATKSTATRPPAGVPAAVLPTEPINLEGARLKGDPNAPVALVIFSDFQCPFCARFARETWPEVDQAFIRTGKALAAFRHLPLKIHDRAFAAAAAAECAGEQGRFWEMHDLLFADPKRLDDESLRERAAKLALNGGRFLSCVGGVGADRVGADFKLASKLRVAGTPTIFVGRRQADGRVAVTDQLKGVGSLALFAAAIGTASAAPSGAR